MHEYAGPERRRFVPCPMHETLVADIRADLERGEKRMDRFESKIDILIERQQEQAVSIQKLNDAIGNGMRSDIRKTMKSMDELKDVVAQACRNYDEQIRELNDFKWFRDWANRFRNNLVAWVLTFVFGMGAVIGLIYLIEKGIK